MSGAFEKMEISYGRPALAAIASAVSAPAGAQTPPVSIPAIPAKDFGPVRTGFASANVNMITGLGWAMQPSNHTIHAGLSYKFGMGSGVGTAQAPD